MNTIIVMIILIKKEIHINSDTKRKKEGKASDENKRYNAKDSRIFIKFSTRKMLNALAYPLTRTHSHTHKERKRGRHDDRQMHIVKKATHARFSQQRGCGDFVYLRKFGVQNERHIKIATTIPMAAKFKENRQKKTVKNEMTNNKSNGKKEKKNMMNKSKKNNDTNEQEKQATINGEC